MQITNKYQMNYSSSRSVPFEIPNINHGLQRANGLLKLEEDGIELEFEVQDAFLGIISSGLSSVFLSYEELQSIRFNKGWFSGKIILEAISMQAFEEIPGTEHAECTLKVKRKHREQAQNIISKARLKLSEQKLSELQEGDD